MSDLAVCRRYAAALQSEAESVKAVEAVDGDVAATAAILAESKELRLLFASPVVSTAKKRTVIETLFSERVSPVFLQFLLLLNSKGRGGLVSDILKEYARLRDRQLGIVEADASAAMALSKEEVEGLRKKLSGLVGADVRLNVDVDPALLGGVVVKVGDTVYDGSLKRRLSVLKSQLEGRSHLKN